MSNIVPVPAGFPVSCNGQANGAPASASALAQGSDSGRIAPTANASSKAAPAADSTGNAKARQVPPHGAKPETSRGPAAEAPQKGSSTGEGQIAADGPLSVAKPVPKPQGAHVPTKSGAANGSGAAPPAPVGTHASVSRVQDVKSEKESQPAGRGNLSSTEVTARQDKSAVPLPKSGARATGTEAKGEFAGKDGIKGTQHLAKQGGNNEAEKAQKVSKKRILESDSDTSDDNLPLSIRHQQLAKKVAVKAPKKVRMASLRSPAPKGSFSFVFSFCGEANL